eukprot:6087714-Prymnesium_polylepis.1
MALPTSLPPTLASWALRRERGATEAQRLWKGVPLRSAQQRGKFVREALRGALRGLEQVHLAGLLHQGLSPSAVLISSEDDRKGEAVTASLQELGFARDASSLYPAFFVDVDGMDLSPSGRAYEEGDTASDPLDLGLAERAVRSI